MIMKPTTATSPIVTFWGAAQSVTGSMHLVEVGDERILLDCGMSRTDPNNPGLRRGEFPFDPASVDCVILSHAHVDHCGQLPYLVEQGFAGPIYCTPATADLIDVMLTDSARIQEEDARQAGATNGDPLPHGLSPRLRVSQVIQRCIPVEYGHTVRLSPNAEFQLHDAGHILGSAMVSLRLAGPTSDVRMTFTGDLGRRGLPYLKPAAPVPVCDLLLSESTYGGRVHQTVDRMEEMMTAEVQRAIDEGGTVLIPAFSLGRTQLVVYYLQLWMSRGRMPKVPIYVDSPLAAEIADVYERYPDLFASSTRKAMAGLQDIEVNYVRSRSESDRLAENSEQCIVVASGGMCDGGRIVKHLRKHVDDPRASIILVSYQAPKTLGRQLLEEKPTVRIHGREWNKWIHVVELNGFSGHADHNDFLTYLSPLVSTTKKVCLVHGEPEAAGHLATSLRSLGFGNVSIPAREESVCVS